MLGLLWTLGCLMVLGARESTESKARREQVNAWREQMLEQARREGRDTAAMRRAGRRWLWLFWLELLGTLVGAVVLLGNSLFVLPVASLLHLPTFGGGVLVLVVSALLVFVSFHALLVDMLPFTGAPEAAQRRYALLAATAVTTAFLLIGILVDTSLAFLALIPFLALLVLEPKLRKRSGVSV
jgi:hypothetical protein